MSAAWSSCMAQMFETNGPALPHAVLMQIWLHVGWSAVLACVGASMVGRWMPVPAGKRDGRQWGVALVLALALWTWVPVPYSPAYWLGLAFQAPSITTVLLCCALLHARFFSTRSGIPLNTTPHRATLALAVVGILAGWALLLDTFALLPLPLPLYAWGFSPAAAGSVLAVALVPWVVVSTTNHSQRSLRLWVVPTAVVAFAASRLPSGNVWDAVLDPWLWLALHAYVARVFWRKLRR